MNLIKKYKDSFIDILGDYLDKILKISILTFLFSAIEQSYRKINLKEVLETEYIQNYFDNVYCPTWKVTISVYTGIFLTKKIIKKCNSKIFPGKIAGKKSELQN